MTERRCPNGHGWHDKSTGCSVCGDEERFNKALRTGSLNSHLANQANRAINEDRRNTSLVKQARLDQKRVEA